MYHAGHIKPHLIGSNFVVNFLNADLSRPSVKSDQIWYSFKLVEFVQNLVTHLTSLQVVPRSFILARASSLKLPCSTPELKE